MMTRKRKAQEELEDCATDDSLSESIPDLESEYIPSSEEDPCNINSNDGNPDDSGDNEDEAGLSSEVRAVQKSQVSESDTEVFNEKSLELAQDSYGSSKRKRSNMASESSQVSDEESDMLTQQASATGPSHKLKRTEKTAVDLQLLSKDKCQHRLWSSAEKAAVWRQLGQCITRQRVPGKEVCLKALEAEPALGSRNWKDLKNNVHNAIMSQKRKLL